MAVKSVSTNRIRTTPMPDGTALVQNVTVDYALDT